MKEFIIDVNIPFSSSSPVYPSYFFSDLRKPGKIGVVIGGSKYSEEIKKHKLLLNLINQLLSAKRARKVNNEIVDEHQDRLVEKISEKFSSGCPGECDDLHIFALAHVGKCPNVLTNDTRMASCRDQIREVVGHSLCPQIRVISSKNAYNATTQQ